MNLKQLEYFVSVAETLSFTKTAQTFFISQTAITQQIKTLEQHLEVKLLNRTKRQVSLTPAGTIFLTEAKDILSRMEHAILKTKKAATGFPDQLNIGIVEGYDNPELPEIIRSFCTGYPNISSSIKEGDIDALYSLLLNQTLDVVINACFTYSKLEEKNIAYKVINQYHLIALLPSSHPLALRNAIHLPELKKDSFIFTSTGDTKDSYGHMESIMSHFIRSGFMPHNVLHSQNFNTTVLMVAANMGVALLPSYAVASSRNLSTLVTIPLEKESDQFLIVAARYKENLNPTIDKFMTYIQDKTSNKVRRS